jgi:hypothetical protein
MVGKLNRYYNEIEKAKHLAKKNLNEKLQRRCEERQVRNVAIKSKNMKQLIENELSLQNQGLLRPGTHEGLIPLIPSTCPEVLKPEILEASLPITGVIDKITELKVIENLFKFRKNQTQSLKNMEQHLNAELEKVKFTVMSETVHEAQQFIKAKKEGVKAVFDHKMLKVLTRDELNKYHEFMDGKVTSKGFAAADFRKATGYDYGTTKQLARRHMDYVYNNELKRQFNEINKMTSLDEKLAAVEKSNLSYRQKQLLFSGNIKAIAQEQKSFDMRTKINTRRIMDYKHKQ